MNTTVVAQSAIGALAALIGGLGGAIIATRPQRSNEQRRQRERAAELLGKVRPLLFELHTDSMLESTPRVEPGQYDPLLERLRNLDDRVRTIGEQLSALAGWWSTPRGSHLAEQFVEAIYLLRGWNLMALEAFRADRDFLAARNLSEAVWQEARSLLDQLRVEIRGEAALAQRRLRLPAHPTSWVRPPGDQEPGGSVDT